MLIPTAIQEPEMDLLGDCHEEGSVKRAVAFVRLFKPNDDRQYRL